MEQNLETPKIDIVDNLTSIIDGLNDLYYNNGTSPLSDECYDELLDLIYEDFPKYKNIIIIKSDMTRHVHLPPPLYPMTQKPDKK